MTTRKKLLNIKGISEAKVDKIKVRTCRYNLVHKHSSLLRCFNCWTSNLLTGYLFGLLEGIGH